MEYLNAQSKHSFELYLELFGAALLVIVAGGALLRWIFHRRERGGYLLAGGLGWLIGFVIATAPFISMTLQSYLTRLLHGYEQAVFPPSWWPGWMPYLPPFTGFVLGAFFGFAAGCYCLYLFRRHRNHNG